eukprot:223793-Rhodomonas_salina.1
MVYISGPVMAQSASCAPTAASFPASALSFQNGSKCSTRNLRIWADTAKTFKAARQSVVFHPVCAAAAWVLRSVLSASYAARA